MSIRSVNGSCEVRIKDAVNLCEGCGGRSDTAYFSYTLSERGGQVSGSLSYREELDEDELDEPPSEGNTCTRDATLTGKRVAVAPGDLKLASKAVAEQFVRAYRDLVGAGMCEPVKGRAKVVVKIEPKGGLRQVLIGGRDYLESCGGRTYVYTGEDNFPNLSGKLQMVAFPMNFPDIGVRVR